MKMADLMHTNQTGAPEMLQTSIRKLLVSTLSRVTGYPYIFCGSPQSLRINARTVPSNRSRPTPYISLHTTHDYFSISFDNTGL